MSLKSVLSAFVVLASAAAFAAPAATTTATTPAATATTTTTTTKATPTAPAATTATAATTAPAATVITYDQVTPALYSQTKTVKGTIVGTFCDEKMCFLNFHKDYRTKLSAVIVAADFAKFTNLAGADIKAKIASLTNKEVQITGKLGEFKREKDATGRPQIYLTDRTNLNVLN